MTLTDTQFAAIMERLEAIERKLDPANTVSISDKAEHLRRAFATGNSKLIKQAKRDINRRGRK